MSHCPLISVIMNCYNGEAFLRQAIDSVLAQSWQHWEIIFWDNQSSDSSAQIVKSYSDSRIKYFYAPTHTLLYEARNYAVRQASGEFLAFLDVDDWWTPDKLALQMPLFDDPEVGMASGNYWLVSHKKNSHSLGYRKHMPSGWVLGSLLQQYSVALLTLIVRKSAFDSLSSSFNPGYHIIGDFDLVIRLASNWKLGRIDTPIAYYRIHENNETGRNQLRQIAELDDWIINMRSDPIVGENRYFINVKYRRDYIAAISCLLLEDKKEAYRYYLQLPWGIFKVRLLIGIVLPRLIMYLLKT